MKIKRRTFLSSIVFTFLQKPKMKKVSLVRQTYAIPLSKNKLIYDVQNKKKKIFSPSKHSPWAG